MKKTERFLLTKEEFYKTKLASKLEKKEEWTKKYAEKLLKSLGCKYIVKIDGNPKYKIRGEKGISTPDFIIGTPEEQIDVLAENPDYFYVDVKEITGSIWANLRESNPFFKGKHPIKKLYQNLQNSQSKTIYRILINEDNKKIIEAIFKPFCKVIEKYGKKRNSGKVGIIFVQSPNCNIPQVIHFLKLIMIIFDSLCNSLNSKISPRDLEIIINLRNKILANKKKGFIPITAPFDNDSWGFLMVVGTRAYEGTTLCLINQTILIRYKDDNSEAIKWLRKLIGLYDFKYKIRL